jgi:hypothetical protein
MTDSVGTSAVGERVTAPLMHQLLTPGASELVIDERHFVVRRSVAAPTKRAAKIYAIMMAN